MTREIEEIKRTFFLVLCSYYSWGGANKAVFVFSCASWALFRRRWGLIVGGGRPGQPFRHACLPAARPVGGGFQQYMHMYSFAIPSLLITSIYLRSANISVHETTSIIQNNRS